MNPVRFKIIGVAANIGKPESRERLIELRRLLQEQGLTVQLDPEAAGLLGRPQEARSLAEIGQQTDLVIVLGGDGTILRVARELGATDTPVLGVNVGTLGFLTSVRAEEMRPTLAEILRGEFNISERHTLETTVIRGGQRLETHRALNDAVISRSAFSRIVRLQLWLDGELLTEYVCDGMIFATATGSTAYSLSAGGPILMPETRAFVVTPICPHALSNRSVIAGRNAAARCVVAGAAGELLLTVDGQVQLRLQVGDEVDVRRAEQTVRLVTRRGHSYFEILRQKLKWSGANV
ncbi:MAG: NAD(+)/NADH kinase [Chloroflexi bacterium]|nr:NAD(+)/NADH kinase [Chloroflexota bacterium]